MHRECSVNWDTALTARLNTTQDNIPRYSPLYTRMLFGNVTCTRYLLSEATLLPVELPVFACALSPFFFSFFFPFFLLFGCFAFFSAAAWSAGRCPKCEEEEEGEGKAQRRKDAHVYGGGRPARAIELWTPGQEPSSSVSWRRVLLWF